MDVKNMTFKKYLKHKSFVYFSVELELWNKVLFYRKTKDLEQTYRKTGQVHITSFIF